MKIINIIIDTISENDIKIADTLEVGNHRAFPKSIMHSLIKLVELQITNLAKYTWDFLYFCIIVIFSSALL